MILTLPEIAPKSIRWSIKYNNSIAVSPITRVSQVVSNNIAQFYGDIDFTPMKINDFYQLQNFLLLLEGKKNSFYFNIPQLHLLVNQNSLSNQFSLNDNNKSYGEFKTSSKLNKSDTSLSLSFGNSCNTVLCDKIIAGSIFSINDEIKVISSINKSTNKWDINFYPEMKENCDAKLNVRFVNPRGIFRLLKDEVSFLSDESNNYIISFSFEEVR